ncbi:cyclase family protein [Patescibacteria group bacterium]|nr:cyclase family protein [Patescibacteria group bacterium]
MNKEIKDISLPFYEGMPVYPGNPEVTVTEESGATSTHSKICLGTHAGTHIDAPRHVFEEGKGIDDLELSKLIGPCRVLDMTHVKECVRQGDLEKENVQEGERILCKTANSNRGFDSFYDDYVYLDGDAAEYLAHVGIVLFGIDSFSVKKRGGDDTRPHDSLLKKEIPIIEGISLKDIEPGAWELIALPVKFRELDGAPARVVLMH